MTKAIFTKGSCKKRELFDTLVSIAVKAGWTMLDMGNTSYTYLHTTGKDGDKNFAIRLCPYDAGSLSSSYDIRTTNYADGVYAMGTYTADPNGGVGAVPQFRTQDGHQTLSFFPGRRYDSPTNTSYNRDGYLLDWDMEYYYYADKECVIFVIVPARYTGKENTIMYFGYPEQTFVEEGQRNYYKPYSGALFASSGHSGSDAGNKRVRVCDNPKNLIELAGKTAQPHYVTSLVPQMSPNIDNKFALSEIFINYGNYVGLRSRLGRVYAIPPSNLIDGDIIQITINNEVQRFRYTTLGAADNDYTSFPTRAVAIRIG